MLEELNITNLGIIENTSLPFTKGLNVLTGETGAGKSMILNGLGLLLGARARANLIGAGHDRLTVEGCWSFDQEPQFLEESNATVEDGELFVSRTVSRDGRSRATVGGRATPASVLAEISSKLVSIHGQSDQLKLKSNAVQLQIIDDFGGEVVATALEVYREKYKAYVLLQAQVNKLEEGSVFREKEREFYLEAAAKIDELGLQPSEDVTLQQEIKKLENLDKILSYMRSVDTLLSNYEDEPDLQLLSSEVHSGLFDASRMDENLKPLLEVADRISEDVAQLSKLSSSYLSDVDYSAVETLAAAQHRLGEILSVGRKYDRKTADGLIEYAAEAHEWLSANPSADDLDYLRVERDDLKRAAISAGEALGAERAKSASSLARAMNISLADLNMGAAVFSVRLSRTDLTNTGLTAIEFLLQAHKKAEAHPVNMTASGGELSRIMLALETVTANTDNLSTFVFDEIDSGVGGETAVQIAKRLAELAKHSQVIVVTHLAQVASFADNHLKIVKSSDDESVATTVEQLSVSDRRGEIARMLSGFEDSDTGLKHADELILFAQNTKGSLAE